MTRAVTSFGDQTPLEAAYEKGHTAVVDEFAKAGAAVAPDSVLNKEIEIKSVSCYGDYDWGYYVDFSCFDASKQIQFDLFWPTVPQWEDADATSNMIWADVNPYVSPTIHRFYKRTGLNTAEIYIKQKASSDFPRMDLRLALRFETPTQGTFRCISQCRDWCAVSVGKFWLKDVPTPAESAKTTPQKKKGRR